MFVDECQAEAAFIVVEMIWERYNEIIEKYPDNEERYKFYRMTVGYRLKAYFAYRATSTIHDLKKRGVTEHHYSLSDTLTNSEGVEAPYSEHHSLARMNIEVDLYILLDSVCTNEVERLIVDLYAMGNTREEIGEKLGMSLARVKKTLRRIKRRIRSST